MRDQWMVGSEPSGEYVHWAQESGALFASQWWTPVLHAVGATATFAWNPVLNLGALVACFRRGPMRIGVLGFPVVGEAWDARDERQSMCDARQIGVLAGVDLLRLNRSMAAANEPESTAARPEVWISDLTSWSAGRSRRLQKDLSFARRANPALVVSEEGMDPAACFALYAQTVGKRGGAVKYTRDYFEALRKVALRTRRLRVFTARDHDGSTRGFAVLAIDHGCAYYLHGASDSKGKREGVADILLEALIGEARTQGAKRFSLMSSPWSQPGLVRFKEKWGDSVGLAPTHDLAIGAMGHAGRLVARWLSRADRHAAQAWQCRETQSGVEQKR